MGNSGWFAVGKIGFFVRYPLGAPRGLLVFSPVLRKDERMLTLFDYVPPKKKPKAIRSKKKTGKKRSRKKASKKKASKKKASKKKAGKKRSSKRASKKKAGKKRSSKKRTKMPSRAAVMRFIRG